MPRSGGGIYSKGSPSVVSGTTIQSAAYNTTIDDLVADANAARPISAGGTGAANAAAARTNLGISATNTPFTPAGNIAATDVQAALAELDTEKAIAADTWTKAEADVRYAQLLADVATTTNIALTDVQNFDGQTGAAGRVVLVTGQSTQSANGLYIMAAGAWSRAAEMSVGGAFASGREVYVRAGIANFGLWRLVTPSPFTLGTSNVNFVREEASPDQIRDAARTPVFIDADANATAFVINARLSDQQARTVIVRDNTGANVRGDILFTTALGWLFRTGASSVDRFRVNDSATPAVEVFGSADVSDEVTGVPWKTWTTTVTPFSGSFTTLGTVTARYQRYGKTVFCRVQIPITTNGTAAGRIDFTLPFTAATSFTGCGVDASTGNQLSIRQVTGTTAGIARYDNVYPGANGANLVVSFFYETV
jgi:hypothetical protein